MRTAVCKWSLVMNNVLLRVILVLVDNTLIPTDYYITMLEKEKQKHKKVKFYILVNCRIIHGWKNKMLKISKVPYVTQ